MKLFFALALLVAGQVHAESNIITKFTGIQEDKQLHFAVGYIGADLVNVAGTWADLPPWKRRAVAIFSMVLLASAKEGIDSITPKNKWDWQDWGATVGGAGIDITLHW